MAKRKSTRSEKTTLHQTSSAPKSVAPIIGAEDMFQWNKTGFDAAMKLSNAIIEGFEHIREMQMHTAQEVHEKNDKVTHNLMQARSPTDLSQLQMDLARFNMEHATRYWQQMFTIGNQMNAKLVEEVKNECLTVGEKINQTLGHASKSAARTKVTAPEPLKAAVDMTNLTLTNWGKAASQWMDTAKNNLENISAPRH